MHSLLSDLVAGCVILAVTAIGVTATSAASQTAETPVYRPTMDDLMHSVIQPRHIKLWLAGKERNWALADYERHNIGGAFARTATALPTTQDMPTADLIATFITPQLADLDTAIKAKDETAFVTAYGALTTGCNGCHQATGHEMVVIKTPDGNSFPDQDFGTVAH